MQMPNASPQGIAGLMQKPPGQMLGQQQPPGQAPMGQAGGQPPMPSPNKASPMAGLGSVDDRVSAYAGNSKPLQQRYAMSQDLLDLLALQKIKSQKDAAARQMQLDMARQQDANGESSMTVAQQREKEVTDLTTNELAEQRGDTAGQQNRDQQQKMQAMLRGGLPTAPGAGMAAQPVAMAAGGIVGYAGGGAVGYATGGEILDKARERRKAAQEKLYTYGLRQKQKDPEGFQAAQAELEAAETAKQEAEKAYAAEMSAAGIDKPVSAASPLGAVKRYEQAQAPVATPAAAAPAAPDVPPPPDAVAAAAAPAAPVVRPPQPAQPAAIRPPQPAAPPAPGASAGMVNPMAGAGLGSLPAGAPAGAPAEGAVASTGNFGDRLKAASLKNAELSSPAEGLKEEERVAGKMALTPAQRQVHDEGIAGLKQMYDQQYDPERQRQEGLTRALIGAGGRAYGELGAAAGAGLDYDAQQRAAKLKEFGGIQSARTGLIDLDRGAVKEGITAGQKRSEDVTKANVAGLGAAQHAYNTDVQGFTNLYNTDATERARTLDREVEKTKNQISAEANKLLRENTSMEKARTWLTATETKLQNTLLSMDKAFQTTNAMLLLEPSKLKPEDKNRLDIATAEHAKNVKEYKGKLQPVIDAAYKQLGVTTGNDLSPADKALIAQYTKGK